MQYSKNPKSFYTMSIRPINNNKGSVKGKGKEKDKLSLQVDLMNLR